MTTDNLEEFMRAYVECALWSSIDEQPDGNGGPPMDDKYGPEDLAPETLDQMRAECKDFIEANAEDLSELDAGQCGHDFWLTRNSHGAGFWDRGYGELGDRLTANTEPWGEAYLYVGTGGKVYCS